LSKDLGVIVIVDRKQSLPAHTRAVDEVTNAAQAVGVWVLFTQLVLRTVSDSSGALRRADPAVSRFRELSPLYPMLCWTVGWALPWCLGGDPKRSGNTRLRLIRKRTCAGRPRIGWLMKFAGSHAMKYCLCMS